MSISGPDPSTPSSGDTSPAGPSFAWTYLAADEPAPGDTTLARDSLAARVRQAVLDLIDTEGLGVGDALPSTGVLAERFGVSRTVVREALSALAALGIIEISNGRSATVRAPDPTLVRFYLTRALRESPGGSFRALMDLRAPLEGRAARLAASALAPEERRADRDALRALLEEMGDALEDPSRYPQLDLHLHREIARLSGNGALHGILEAVSPPLFRAMRDLRVARHSRGLMGAEHAEHVRIVGAILEGDPDAAERAMDEHMDAVAALDSSTFPGSALPPR
ncbi:FadR/GntR family transcriptional regulator [Brachybacterium endophyticum]|uniref:FadR/GntR family transcriptional regulator n=1 Tax=Brachybacterium endophyticum TaxID=2182385 RepID=UPI001401FDFB|nr:FadR/GntR family transcriptional regulator [Brachybacterium endophyticum]